MTSDELRHIEASCRRGMARPKDALALIAEVRRLRAEVDELHDNRMLVIAERNEWRTLAEDRQPALPPGHVAVSRALLERAARLLSLNCVPRMPPALEIERELRALLGKGGGT